MVGTPWLRQVAPHLSRYQINMIVDRFPVITFVALPVLAIVSQFNHRSSIYQYYAFTFLRWFCFILSVILIILYLLNCKEN
jgi:hypothetical protein